MAAAAAYDVAPGTPEEQGAALAQRGLWAETWDGGDSWHASGNREQGLSPKESTTECAALEAVEAEDYAAYGTNKPDSEAAAKASALRAVHAAFTFRAGSSVGAPSAPEYVLGDICAAARRFKATGDATSALAGGDLASCTLG